MDRLGISVVESEGKDIVKVNGDIDAYSTGELKKFMTDLISRTEKSTLVIDMSNVPYVDSAGLGMLVSILRESKSAGKSLVLASMKPNVKRIFELTRLDKVFTITDTVQEA
ncbi:MAG: anti-sigma factor antagonist [Thermotogota bacterium]|nr:anti-sigma factor antagonist [Thermotogota bacterium]MDK2864263.1 anti-sigma factor antagonist [Thermotogota bacterium]